MDKYILRYEQYKPGNGVNWEVEVDWASGIKICRQLTEQHEGKWTRHPSFQGVASHCNQYWDLYNEGNIILVPVEERNLLTKLKNKKYETE